MAKYNWKQLEKEYILGNYKTVASFLKEKNISNNGSTKNKTKGWKNKKVLSEEIKSTKIIEKVLEKEAEREAKQIANIKSIANDLALNIIKANKELNRHIAKSKTKTKKVEYDKKTFKPSKEETIEKEEINDYISIIDRQGLKMLTSALKDLSEILIDKKETEKEDIDNAKNILIKIKEVAENDKSD